MLCTCVHNLMGYADLSLTMNYSPRKLARLYCLTYHIQYQFVLSMHISIQCVNMLTQIMCMHVYKSTAHKLNFTWPLKPMHASIACITILHATMQITNITTSRKLEDILHIYLLFMVILLFIRWSLAKMK